MVESDISEGSSAEELLQLVIFRLSGEEFGTSIAKVKEIIRIPDITRIPQVPEYVEGIINLRSNVLPVINLATRFNLPHEGLSDHSRIVVVELDNIIAGIVVDAVTEVLNIPTDCIEPTPEMIASKIGERYIEGVGKLDERMLIILDIDKIFSDEQKMQINNLENAGPVPA